MNLLEGVHADASLSECGTYRYALWRTWGPGRTVMWIMLNPSTADAHQDDPTVRRCQSFSREWGYDGIVVANLFALRATEPKALYKHKEPVGPDNDRVLRNLAGASDLVVAAWGTHGFYRGREASVRTMLRHQGTVVVCLGRTKSGSPRHPLYVKGDTLREVYA